MTHELEPHVTAAPRPLPKAVPAIDMIENYSQWSDQHPALATVAETVGAFMLKRTVIRTGNEFGVNFGNAHARHYVDRGINRPGVVAFGAVVAGPIQEELFFRTLLTNKLPRSRFMQSRYGERAHNIAAVASTVGFAMLGHGFDPMKPRSEWAQPDTGIWARGNGVRTLNPPTKWGWALPIGSFIGGEQYRHIYHKRGLKHAVASHALNNAMTIVWEGAGAARDLKRQNPTAKITVKSLLKHAKLRRT